MKPMRRIVLPDFRRPPDTPVPCKSYEQVRYTILNATISQNGIQGIDSPVLGREALLNLVDMTRKYNENLHINKPTEMGNNTSKPPEEAGDDLGRNGVQDVLSHRKHGRRKEK